MESKKKTFNDILTAATALSKLPTAKRNSTQVQAELRNLNIRGGAIRRQYQTDEGIVKQLEVQREACLRTALINYRNCITTGNTHDLQVRSAGMRGVKLPCCCDTMVMFFTRQPLIHLLLF